MHIGSAPSCQHYVDGALSNNMPLFEQRNTITVAPFSGESDICPREGTYNFFEVHYGNVSIQINMGNVHRICTSFLPPRLEVSVQVPFHFETHVSIRGFQPSGFTAEKV